MFVFTIDVHVCEHVCLSPTCKQCVVLSVHGCLFMFHLINVIYTAQVFNFNNIPFMFAPVILNSWSYHLKIIIIINGN